MGTPRLPLRGLPADQLQDPILQAQAEAFRRSVVEFDGSVAIAAQTALAPDQVAVLGDHALFGPQPAETIDLLRSLQKGGALITAGTGDIAVARACFCPVGI
mgnify:CR=1 FL=1